MANYTFEPQKFALRFLRISKLQFDKHSIQICYAIAGALTWALYVPFSTALALVNFLPFRGDLGDQLASLCFKMFTLCLFVQPFVHISHGRYWTSFAPLAGLAAGFLARSTVLYFGGEERGPDSVSTTSRRIFLSIQILYIFVVLVIAVAAALA